MKGDIVQRVRVLAGKVKTLRNATRLWNWIDCQPESDAMWDAMLAACPWAFHDPQDPNSMRFTY